ncbi:hypothetical protein WH47_00743 [Habropoda laboriosa]|uniref:Uncharacterized protein n=1 Tax=Habropoda laboriosa TaxID=597456 RepID=A0A0L7QYI5_9HYME|nr:hypothetical protein WH47_00743 [Habropoda laboriosa]
MEIFSGKKVFGNSPMKVDKKKGGWNGMRTQHERVKRDRSSVVWRLISTTF